MGIRTQASNPAPADSPEARLLLTTGKPHADPRAREAHFPAALSVTARPEAPSLMTQGSSLTVQTQEGRRATSVSHSVTPGLMARQK